MNGEVRSRATTETCAREGGDDWLVMNFLCETTTRNRNWMNRKAGHLEGSPRPLRLSMLFFCRASKQYNNPNHVRSSSMSSPRSSQILPSDATRLLHRPDLRTYAVSQPSCRALLQHPASHTFHQTQQIDFPPPPLPAIWCF